VQVIAAAAPLGASVRRLGTLVQTLGLDGSRRCAFAETAKELDELVATFPQPGRSMAAAIVPLDRCPNAVAGMAARRHQAGSRRGHRTHRCRLATLPHPFRIKQLSGSLRLA
jgi:hypothetical protein